MSDEHCLGLDENGRCRWAIRRTENKLDWMCWKEKCSWYSELTTEC